MKKIRLVKEVPHKKSKATEASEQTQTPEEQKASNRLEELAQNAAEDKGENTFMQPEKKKRGRKPGTKNKPKEPEALDPSVVQAEIEKLKPIVSPVVHTFSKLGVKLAESDDAAMTEHEIIIITDAASACLQQYLPMMLSEHANLIVLTITMSQWAARVYVLRQQKLEELRKQKAALHLVDSENEANETHA